LKNITQKEIFVHSLGLFRSSKLTAKAVVIALAAGLLGIGIAATSSPPPAAASTACSASAASTYTAGRGLVGDPYQIATSADLIRISTTSADWSGLYFVQTANIDLGSCEWPGIGTRSQAFTGTYDGGFYTVSGFRMTTSTAPDVGFFNRISQTTIRNLTIQGSITSDRSFVGGLVGSAPYSTPASTITQVNSKVDISYSGGDYAGGIVGGLHTNSVLSFSTHSGQLSSSRGSAAGLTGYGEGIIESSYSRATFTGASTYKSGLNGWANPVIRRSYSVGSGADGGIAGTFLINSSTQVFWDTSIVGAAATSMRNGGTITEATGKTTVEMKTLDTFSSTNFRIVDGWDTFTTASWSNFATTPPSAAKIWGICSGVNDGYPFLLWEYTTDPCTVAPPPSSSGSGSSGSVYVAPVVVPEAVIPLTIRQTTTRPATDDKPARLLGRSLDKDVLFIADSARLSPAAKKSLRQAARLAIASDGKVAVTGFAALTNRGSAYEKSVAQKRALAVARYLRAQGFDDWIYYQGLSGRQGLAFEGDPRRVEIRILN
jgi:outer membrane protein OmpA-like peptidoglycan-associated protein